MIRPNNIGIERANLVPRDLADIKLTNVEDKPKPRPLPEGFLGGPRQFPPTDSYNESQPFPSEPQDEPVPPPTGGSTDRNDSISSDDAKELLDLFGPEGVKSAEQLRRLKPILELLGLDNLSKAADFLASIFNNLKGADGDSKSLSSADVDAAKGKDGDESNLSKADVGQANSGPIRPGQQSRPSVPSFGQQDEPPTDSEPPADPPVPPRKSRFQTVDVEPRRPRPQFEGEPIVEPTEKPRLRRIDKPPIIIRDRGDGTISL